eukprot:6204873-Pleurochrysis_carterae.AAC.2
MQKAACRVFLPRSSPHGHRAVTMPLSIIKLQIPSWGPRRVHRSASKKPDIPRLPAIPAIPAS